MLHCSQGKSVFICTGAQEFSHFSFAASVGKLPIRFHDFRHFFVDRRRFKELLLEQRHALPLDDDSLAEDVHFVLVEHAILGDVVVQVVFAFIPVDDDQCDERHDFVFVKVLQLLHQESDEKFLSVAWNNLNTANQTRNNVSISLPYDVLVIHQQQQKTFREIQNRVERFDCL